MVEDSVVPSVVTHHYPRLGIVDSGFETGSDRGSRSWLLEVSMGLLEKMDLKVGGDWKVEWEQISGHDSSF